MDSDTDSDTEETETFPSLGDDTDTVSFQFNDEGRVIAARPFLTYVSPVFSAMFQNEWKDSTTGVFVIEDIKREDFVEFLQCLDPGIMKDVTDSNVLRVCPIADKYQSPALMEKCQDVLTNTINKIIKDQENSDCPKSDTKLLKSLFVILHTINKIDAYIKTKQTKL